MRYTTKKIVISGVGLALAACLFVATVILSNTVLKTWRIDLTEHNLFTLSEGTINILEELEEPVELNFYLSRKAIIDFPYLANYGVRVSNMLEEYVTYANGKLILNVIEPEAFSETEDQAVASGLRTISKNSAGDRVYFGLVGTNSTDDEKVIPFFNIDRESALEYDITKLIYNLSYPNKRIVGVISQLPIMANIQQADSRNWVVIDALNEFFDVKNLGEDIDLIEQNIDVLMLVHPKELPIRTRYAIDQYLLHGGKAIIFIDPLAEQDKLQIDADSKVLPKIDSYLAELIKPWGISMVEGKIAGDINAAIRVKANTLRGPKEIDYLPWLRLSKKHFNADDFSSSNLNTINMATSGVLEVTEKKGLAVTPLIQTSINSTLLERDLILFQRDPTIVLKNYNKEGRKLLLAARIQGAVKSSFPEGAPLSDKEEKKVMDSSFIREGNINVILVADTDILADFLWVRTQNKQGSNVPQPIANNGDFVINSIENLSGNVDLISLRGRGKYSRPFEVVENIRKEAEKQFRQRVEKLENKLKTTEERMRQLQQEQGEKKTNLLNSKLAKEIEKLRGDRSLTRKELRNVQHELRKNIEKLGAKLRFINIALIPLLIIFVALIFGIYRANKRI